MMNWTGGQLQRHHARSGLLTKAQKQNFAKSRLHAQGTDIVPPSPFPNFPDFKGSSTEAETNKNQAPAEEPVSHLTAAHLTRDQTSGASELNNIKRQLLKESDWAAVSVTRPLELAFTSADEIERFGKRRKLNDQDRKRLVAAKHNRSTFFALPEQRRARHPSSVIDTIEDIQIEINGRPVGRPNDSSNVAINSLSSQSMLLDHEGSAVPEPDMQKENQTATWITNLFPRSK